VGSASPPAEIGDVQTGLRAQIAGASKNNELGNKAGQAARVIYLGALLLTALSLAGFVRALATPGSRAFAAPEPEEADADVRVPLKV